MTTIQGTRKPSQGSRGALMWLLYLCDAALLVTSGFHLTFSSGLAYTVLAVGAVAVVMLALTGWLLWQRQRISAGPRS
jgi:hypothetical protein